MLGRANMFRSGTPYDRCRDASATTHSGVGRVHEKALRCTDKPASHGRHSPRVSSLDDAGGLQHSDASSSRTGARGRLRVGTHTVLGETRRMNGVHRHRCAYIFCGSAPAPQRSRLGRSLARSWVRLRVRLRDTSTERPESVRRGRPSCRTRRQRAHAVSLAKQARTAFAAQPHVSAGNLQEVERRPGEHG